MAILALVFAATWFVTGAMAAHLPRLLEIAGARTTAALGAAALVGPAQVAARLVEFGAPRMVHPLASARVAAVLHPIGAVILGLMGPGAITAFAVLHGAGNGLLTIAKGTVPLAIFGPVGYGLRSGILGAPARRDAGGIAAALRAFDGSYGRRRAGDLGRPQLERVFRAAAVKGSAGRRTRAGIAMALEPGRIHEGNRRRADAGANRSLRPAALLPDHIARWTCRKLRRVGWSASSSPPMW
jgi:hypothetical protein